MTLHKEKDKKKKKDKKRKREEKEGEGGEEEEEEYIPILQVGDGRIISSGVTVTGTETCFMKQLGHGDAIVIQHPYTLEQETRIITMVLSDVSIGISSPFSSDLISGTKFEFIKKPKEKVDTTGIENEKKKKRSEMEKQAFGTVSLIIMFFFLNKKIFLHILLVCRYFRRDDNL